MQGFNLNCYWGVREESLDSCANRLTEFLKKLKQIDDLFARLVPTATRRWRNGKSLDDDVKECLAAGVSYTDVGHELMRDLGFTLSMHVPDDEETMTVWIACGCFSPWVRNVCSIDLPTKGKAAKRLLQVEPLVRIMGAAARHWEPDRGRVGWTVVDPVVPNVPVTSRDFDWMTYFSRLERANFPSLPKHARVVPVDSVGTIIIAQDAPPDVNNLDDLQNIARVEAALAASE